MARKPAPVDGAQSPFAAGRPGRKSGTSATGQIIRNSATATLAGRLGPKQIEATALDRLLQGVLPAMAGFDAAYDRHGQGGLATLAFHLARLFERISVDPKIVGGDNEMRGLRQLGRPTQGGIGRLGEMVHAPSARVSTTGASHLTRVNQTARLPQRPLAST